MKKLHGSIRLDTTRGPVFVSQAQAVALLGVHAKTAQRWASGRQVPSRERAALLAILSGQVMPFAGWEGFTVRMKAGPPPGRRPFAVLVTPEGREWLPDDLLTWRPVSGSR